ncbi:substrate-binding periplasmic protein [Aliamphritea ceti]|uniref:substrate-binding periplasmic protein n=1 Tax=Aliamphritea ceti TaxID=1524258 RepID=UPI0021C44F24|nr:transporter substrate-binding domain-containing protein [Aliamphritea ceti]
MQRIKTAKPNIDYLALQHRLHCLVHGLFLLLLSLSVQADVKQLTFATIANSVNSQISLQVMREAYKKLDIDVDADFLPASRSLMMASYGQYDGELYRIAGISEDYPHLLKVPTPINQVEVVAFCRTDDDNSMTLESLKGYRLGVRRGVRFNVHLPLDHSTQEVASNQQLFNMLEKSRIDIALLSRSNGLQILKEMEVTDISPLNPPLLNLDLYHYVHIRHQQIIPHLDQILQAMHTSGRIREIRENYLDTLFN